MPAAYELDTETGAVRLKTQREGQRQIMVADMTNSRPRTRNISNIFRFQGASGRDGLGALSSVRDRLSASMMDGMPR